MEAVFGPVLNTFLHVSLDNIIVTSASFEEHLENLKIVFQLQQQGGGGDHCKNRKMPIWQVVYKVS